MAAYIIDKHLLEIREQHIQRRHVLGWFFNYYSKDVDLINGRSSFSNALLFHESLWITVAVYFIQEDSWYHVLTGWE